MYSRRQFLGYGSAAFIAASGRVFGAEAPSNRVRLAIVGCHELGRGQQVMKSALRVPGVDIACVCDVDSRAMDWAAAKVFEISGVMPKKERDFRKVLEDQSIDGVILETPDHWHALGAVMAMRAGKAVYVEKPCAFCPREGEVLLETQRKTGMVLQVGSQRRSSKTYRDAIKLLHSGAIGEPRWTKCWYMAKRESIGIGRESPVPEWLDCAGSRMAGLGPLAGTCAAHGVPRQRRSLQLALVSPVGHCRDRQQHAALCRCRALGARRRMARVRAGAVVVRLPARRRLRVA